MPTSVFIWVISSSIASNGTSLENHFFLTSLLSLGWFFRLAYYAGSFFDSAELKDSSIY